MNFLSELISNQSLQFALIIAIFIGGLAGVVGSFSILDGMALLSDSLSHAIFPGIIISMILGIPLVIGAGIFGVIAVLLINLIKNNSKLKSDVIIGIIYPTFFAIGMILVIKNKMGDVSDEILFGDILSVNFQDLLMVVLIGIIVLIFIFIQYRKLQLTIFDKNFAQFVKLNVPFLETALTLAIAAVIIISIKAIGVILVTALLIIPAASAYLISNSFKKMTAISAIIGILSSIIGLVLSYQLDLPSGPSIVLTSFAFFVLSFLFKKFTSLNS